MPPILFSMSSRKGRCSLKNYAEEFAFMKEYCL